MAHEFFDQFSRTRVINLKHREDRRRESTASLASVGTGPGQQDIDFFSAVQPHEADPFPEIGIKGCFLSHLAVLRDARDKGVDRLLILEDDAQFGRAFKRRAPDLAKEIAQQDWDIFYPGGSVEGPAQTQGALAELPATTPVRLAHAVGFSAKAIARAVPYLEAMLERPFGSDDGGPMHVDGAYSWLRRDMKDLRTIAASPMLIVQRFSGSDISDTGQWHNRIPGIGLVRRIRNSLL